ncbi:hypothetical protein [Saccharothrix sp. Mg75]|uniref:hypothetical protein n=1 Tax=Saccharothrix sp. Mg75 TaxID=3445357 RepID=UPI003EEFF2E1
MDITNTTASAAGSVAPDPTLEAVVLAASGLGVLGTVLIVLARSGQLKPLIAAVARVITVPLALLQHVVERQSANARRRREWRDKLDLAERVKDDPDLLAALRSVHALVEGHEQRRSEDDVDSPTPPDEPPTSPGTVVALDRHRARGRSPRRGPRQNRTRQDRTGNGGGSA